MRLMRWQCIARAERPRSEEQTYPVDEPKRALLRSGLRQHGSVE